MNNKNFPLNLILALLFITGYISCKKDVATNAGNTTLSFSVSTDPVGYYGFTGATCGGNVTSDGGSAVSAKGVCWNTSPDPTISLSTKTLNGSGLGTFTSSITGLLRGKTYYVRAYATNSNKTVYGNEESFTTNASLATLTTTSVTSTLATSATNAVSGGNISDDGGGPITARGVIWSQSTPFPTIALNTKTNDGTGTGSFTSNISGLTPNTLNYVRAYATNSAGTSYANDISFSTTLISPYFTIGQSYGGGIIFYIDATLQHGLIAATNDQSTAASWGCRTTYSSAISTMGQSNTSSIVAQCNELGIAARICDQLVLNGYSDWFLPSKGELNTLYLQKAVVGGFTNNRYWSSNEREVTLWTTPVNEAYNQIFLNGTTALADKSTPYYARAIRAF